MSSQSIETALQNLGGADERTARQALDTLDAASRPWLVNVLCRRTGSRELAQDAVQDAFIKIWRSRESFTDRGVAAWHGYLKTVAERCYLDRVAKERRELATEDLERVPDEDLPVVLDMLNVTTQDEALRHLYRCADLLWLEMDSTLSARMHARQALAAHYFYLDGLSWQETLELLGPQPLGEAPLTRQTLDKWLMEAGVLRRMAFDVLYYDKSRLAWHLLGQPEPVHVGQLDGLMRALASGQLAVEISVLLWRYGCALRPEEIVGRDPRLLNVSQVAAVLDSLEARLPFKENMERILVSLQSALGMRTMTLFQTPGLWQRMAFHYNYVEELPHLDINARLQPAAERAGYKINPGILNVWLSGKRLLTSLARAYTKLQEGESDA